MKELKIVMYDFDGTLCAGDSTTDFWKYCIKKSYRAKLFLCFLWPLFILKVFGIVSKELFRQWMFLFLTKDMIKKLVPDFIKEHRAGIWGWAFDMVKSDKQAGFFVICSTGMREYMAKGMLAGFEFDKVFCSEVLSDRPWKFRSRSCLGFEKVNLLKKWAKENGIKYKVVKAYSDSKLDIPMMLLAKDKVWVDYKTGDRVKKPKH